MATILIVDDDELIRELLSQAVSRLGHRAVGASSLAEARRAVVKEEPDLIYLDVRMPDGSGLEAIEELRAAKSAPEVIIITGRGDPDGAELALRCGVWDYIEKPSSVDRMLLPLMRALTLREERSHRTAPALPKQAGILGASRKIAACLAQAAMAAASDVDVLITGETGTGKELFARAMHQGGGRARGAFVVVDCTTLPANLAESELFGHERGSFTGADRRQVGLIEQADGGTLFLDEVGELPQPMQAKFLRVLQERRFRPVGGAEKKSDFRLVAATNRDLAAMARRGEFREDLLYRLRAFAMELPPLREREGDIRELALRHLARAGEQRGRPMKQPSPEFLDLLETHDWPGNVRELFQTLDMCLVSAQDEAVLLPQHLPIDLRVRLMRGRMDLAKGVGEARQDGLAEPPAPDLVAPEGGFLPWKAYRQKAVDALEQSYFTALLARCGGDAARAARLSGLGAARLYELLQKHGIATTRKSPGA